MSNKQIAVQVTDVCSNQEWTTDPDMIEVTVDAAFLEKAEKCVAFMQENDISYMCIWWAFGYSLYKLGENLSAEEKEDKSAVVFSDQEYVEFEPEYRLDGCNAKIFKDGDIRAVLPFKHSNDELWCEIGTVASLKLKLDGSASETEEQPLVMEAE